MKHWIYIPVLLAAIYAAVYVALGLCLYGMAFAFSIIWKMLTFQGL